MRVHGAFQGDNQGVWTNLKRLFLEQVNIIKNFSNSKDYDVDKWIEFWLKGGKRKE